MFELPPVHAYLQRAILRFLLTRPAEELVSAPTIAAGLAGDRAPASVANAIRSMRKWIESRKGPGGGYRLHPLARQYLAHLKRR